MNFVRDCKIMLKFFPELRFFFERVAYGKIELFKHNFRIKKTETIERIFLFEQLLYLYFFRLRIKIQGVCSNLFPCKMLIIYKPNF